MEFNFEAKDPIERLYYYMLLIVGGDADEETLKLLWAGKRLSIDLPKIKGSYRSRVIKRFSDFLQIKEIRQRVGPVTDDDLEEALKFYMYCENDQLCECLKANFDPNKMNKTEALHYLKLNWFCNFQMESKNKNILHLAAEKRNVQLLNIACETFTRNGIEPKLFYNFMKTRSNDTLQEPLHILATTLSSEVHDEGFIANLLHCICSLGERTFDFSCHWCSNIWSYLDFKRTKHEHDLSVAEMLISTGTRRNRRTNVFFYCLDHRYFQVFQHLIKQLPTDISYIRDEAGNTLLHVAVDIGNHELIQQLLFEQRIRASVANHSGKTSLMTAAALTDWSITEMLLGTGNRQEICSIQDENGDIALGIAVKNFQNENVEILIQFSNVNSINNKGESILDLLLRFRSYETLMLFRNNFQLFDSENWRRFQKIADEKHGKENFDKTHSRSECHKIGIDFHERNSQGYVCIRRGDVEAFSLLEPDETIGDSLLLFSAVCGQSEIMDFILRNYNCCNVNATTSKYPSTPLILASNNGHVGAVQVLLKTPEVDVGFVGNYGLTALHLATLRNHYRVVENLLLDNRCNVNEITKFTGQSALSIACALGYLEIVDLLCNQWQTDLRMKDRFGLTPLQVAMEENQFESAHRVAKEIQKRLEAEGKLMESKIYEQKALLAISRWKQHLTCEKRKTTRLFKAVRNRSMLFTKMYKPGK